MSSLQKTFKSTISLSFPTENHANMVMTVLDVDEELQPERMSRVFSVEGNTLSVTFEAVDPKLLRVGVSSFVDMASVAVKTLLEFDDSC